MPFSPLPRTFLRELRERAPGTVVELGCADGRFSRLLSAAGAYPWRLDRRPPGAGSVADLVADARALPLATGCVDLLVAANLLRHLWPRLRGAAVPPDWQRCLRPGGRLFVFEDEPRAAPVAARNYRDLQAWLARLAPESRGPLLPRSAFAACARRGAGGCGRWRFGGGANRWPSDVATVLELLAGRERAPGGEAARLTASLRRHGLSYGDYWWAAWQPQEET